MKKADLLCRILSITRIALLALSLWLVANGLGVYAGYGESMLFMYANLTGFAFWVLFLMGAILLVPAGRVICALCPAGEINEFVSRRGAGMTVAPGYSFLSALTMAGIFFCVILFHISRHPHYTALLIAGAFAAAAGMGMLFRGNAFCTTLCPANAFLRLYGRFSAVVLKGGDDCAAGRPCMVMLNPCNVRKSQCHLCLRCFSGSRGLKLGVEQPVRPAAFAEFTNDELISFALLSGLTFMAFIRVVREFRELFVYPAFVASQSLGIADEHMVGVVAAFGVVVYPVAAVLVFSALLRPFSGTDLPSTARRYLPVLLPPLFALHFILAVVKVNARGGFMPWAFTDPSGRDMVALFAARSIEMPGDIIPIAFLKYLVIAVPLAAFVLSVRPLWLRLRERKTAAVIALAVQTACFAGILVCIRLWLFRSSP